MKRLDWYIEVIMGGGINFHSIPKIINYLKYRMVPPETVAHCAPQMIQLMMTNKCNLNCDYCAASKFTSYGFEKKELNLESIKTIFQHPLCKNALLADLGGGEPLLVADLEESIRFLRDRGYLVNISTNALLLKKKIEGLKKAGITRINVSIYPTNMNLLERDLPEINRVFPVHTSFVLTKQLLENRQDKILETIRFIKKSGSKSIRFYNYRATGNNADIMNVFNEDFIPYNEFRNKAAKEFGSFLKWDTTITSFDKKRKRNCRQLWQRVTVTAEGKIKVCCGSDLTLPDNITFSHSNFEEIFNHQIYRNFRSALLNDALELPEICRFCNYLEDSGY